MTERTCLDCTALAVKASERCTPCRVIARKAATTLYRTSEFGRRMEAERYQKIKQERGIPNVGDVVPKTCKRCGESFTWVFPGGRDARRAYCDLCMRHKSDWFLYRLTGPQAAARRSAATCDICNTTENPGGQHNEWVIDHNHSTGVVRGLLCAHCNTALGLMRDSPARLRAAANYLERNSHG